MPDIWVDVDTAVIVPVNILPLIDDTDFKTIETAVVYNSAGLALTWNFVTSAGVVTGTAVTPTTAGVYDWSEPIADKGMYAIEIPASGGASINNATEGYGWFTGVATGVLPWRGPTIGFRAAGLNDKMCDSAYDTTRGLAGTALPAAAADAAGGLPISDVGGLDLDTQIKTNIDAILVDTGTTLQAEVDGIQADTEDIQSRLPAALTANGNMKSSLMEILATVLTETAGQIAGAFKKFFDKAAPTGTVNSLPDAVAGAAGGVFIAGTNAATNIVAAAGDALTLTGQGTGSGLKSNGGASGAGADFVGGATTGGGIIARAQTQGTGFHAVGAGTGAGTASDGGATNGAGFAASGAGSGAGIKGTGGPTNGSGIVGVGQGSGAGQSVVSTGTGDGFQAAGSGGGADINADITGNLSGSIGSLGATAKADVNAEVDTAIADARLDELLAADSDIDGLAPPTVGSVVHEMLSKTAGSFTFDQTTDSLEAVRDKETDIETDTQDIQGRTPAALTGAGNMKADALAIDGSTAAATNLKQSASVIYVGSVTGAATTTTLIDAALTEAATDFWKGRIIIFLSGALKYQATDITAFDPATDKLTFTALTAAPSGADTYVVL